MSNIKSVETKLTGISVGDTVIVDGVFITVGKRDIKNCPFMGVSLFGDASIKTITKVLFIVPTNNGIRLR